MPACDLAQCQQERRFIRQELNKWTKNLLLQTGLETIATNYFEINSSSFRLEEERIPLDFNPNEKCLFCINRQEYFSNQSKQYFSSNDETDRTVHENEDAPLDLSFKSTSNPNSHSLLDVQSDNLPVYHPEELLLSSRMNFDYFSRSLPNVNLFPTFPINQYPFNSSLLEDYVTQLAKQMAYLRMIQEIDNQRHDRKSKVTMNSPNASLILTESMHVNQIINDIMTRTLKDVYEEQIKQPSRVSKQGELLFVKKQNHEKNDLMIWKRNKLQKPNNQGHPSLSGSSSTLECSPLIHRQNQKKSQSSTSTSRRRVKDILSNSEMIVNTNGKQIRPKRGQYRRYQSEQLVKAVVAVLSNEMSVHKAGSYFGVPHSTLEYKVKERNSKMSLITKTESSPATSVIENRVSMGYDTGTENGRLSTYTQSKNGKNTPANNCEHYENKSNAEELQLHKPVALVMN